MIAAEPTTVSDSAAMPCAENETEELLQAASRASGDERARIERVLAVRHLSLVRKLAAQYARRGAETEDLVQVRSLALIKAMRRYDHTKGEFVAFARATIFGEIKPYFRDNCWSERPTRRLQELQPSVSAAVELHRRRRRNEPTALQIADEPGIAVREVREAKLAAGGDRPRSLDHPTGASERTLAEKTLCNAENMYDFVDEWVTVSALCGALGADDRRLLALRFIEDKSQREIGVVLGISQMQVSRRLRRLLNQMHEDVYADDRVTSSIA